ncbi:MORC family CW-type zinc finger protein 1 [Sphaerodactylus townsendi]|uniref:MORC family CW-type zinc finger protein 1 n=1 Tax=Sphaerodactylus townsendi TaxID=933632 RepID=UPI002025F7D9|nr:MORC family CW-type zinc finger protein 1 [Sphaerodactylus townsendi]
MSATTGYKSLCRAELRLEYLHANSTTHDFLFGAVAELIDNSRDAGATRLDIFTVNNETLQGGFMLCFLDNGCGMTPRETTDLVYFGRSSKRTMTKMIGHYGNGLKSGAMRIGKDFILFTKKESTMTCLLFSQTFCETEGLTEVIVPIPSWSSTTRNPVMDDPEKFATQLSIICKYSPFKSEAELMKQFDVIYGKSGTLVVIYNLKLMLDGKPELDIQTDEVDILIAGGLENIPEQQSLRAYTALLYFKPQMRIFIQAKKVETKHLPYCFYRPRKYPYKSPLKDVATHESKTAEMELNCAKGAVKDTKGGQKHLQDSLLHEHSELEAKGAQVAEWNAVGNDTRIRSKLKDRQRNLRKSKILFLIFGINIQNRSQDGMLIYSNSRLIRVFEKVGPQKRVGSYLGAGAVGMVDVPLEVMEPTHNKQSFANVKQYNRLLKSMESYLLQYWKDIGISQKGEFVFWNDFGYLGAKWNDKPSDTVQYKRRRAVEIPDIVQCDICLKWRLLSLDTDINNEGHHDIWTCGENKCHVPENLPSVPLGTILPSSESLNDKLLADSIQQCQSKQKNLPLQNFYWVEPHTVVPHTEDYRTIKDKNETIKKTVSWRKAVHKDPSPACSRLIKNSANKRRVQKSSLQTQPPAKQKICSQRKWHPHQEAKHCVSKPEDRKDHNISVLRPLEVQDKQPLKKEPDVIKTETDKMTEVICIIISDSESEDLPKYEDFAFIPKADEKQEQYDDKADVQLDLAVYATPEEKDLCQTDSESGSTEKSKGQSQEEQALVDRQNSEVAASPTREPSHENKMIETLTDLIKEYITCMSTQDILSMFQLKGHSELNENIPLEMHQHFLRYQSQRLKDIHAMNQDILEPIHAIETKIGLCEVQVKTVKERLKHLREKIAQFLLKIHSNLVINSLEDIDGYLEAIQNEEHLY